MAMTAAAVGECIGAPLLLGALLRLGLPQVRADLLALFSSAVFLFLVERISALSVLRMRNTVETMFHDPFNIFSTWVVAVLFVCIVLTRVAIPYLLARRGVWLVDRLSTARGTQKKTGA